MGKNRYLLHAGFSLKDNGSRYMKWTQPLRSLAFGKTLNCRVLIVKRLYRLLSD